MAKKDNSNNEVNDELEADEDLTAAEDEQASRVDELTADLQRVQAEFVNYRRRVESEKAEMLELGKGRVVREFLSARDSFDQELAHRPKSVDPKWAATIDSIRAQFDQVLNSLGVEKFGSKGHAFDPHIHDAIAMEDGEGDHEIVLEELQPGYKLGDRILRHAIVKVGKSDQAPEGELPSESSE